MKAERENTWVLSAIELNICAQLLGRDDWDDFPVLETGKPLEQRMLEGFLRLTELGLLEPDGVKFRCTDMMRDRMECVVWPEVVYSAAFPDRMPRTLYQLDKRRVLVEQIPAERQLCRVMPVQDEGWEDLICGEAAEIWNTQSGSGEVPEAFPSGVKIEMLLEQSECLVWVQDGDRELLRFLRVLRDEGGVWLGSFGAETLPYSTEALTAALGQE